MQNLFLKLPAPCKGLDGTCHLARSYVELLQLKSTDSNKQKICYIFGIGLLSFKQQKNKHEFWNSTFKLSYKPK